MSGFVIKRGPQELVIEEGSLDAFFGREDKEACLNIPADRQPGASAALLCLLPSAFSEMDAHIHWKSRTRSNLQEQGGLMIGDVFRDPDTGRICGVVRHIIPSENAGNATYLQFTHEDWSRMLLTYEEQFPQQEDGRRLKIIGWYHTHPNMPTHMSQIDKHTHRSFWGKEWQFSAIMNPQRGTWEVFNGTECDNCNGVLYYDSQWTPQAPEPDFDPWQQGMHTHLPEEPEPDPEERQTAVPPTEDREPGPDPEERQTAAPPPEDREPEPGPEERQTAAPPPEDREPEPGPEERQRAVPPPEDREPEPGPEERQRAVPPPEDREPEPRRGGVPSTGDFIIKRGPEYAPAPRAAQRTWNSTAQPNPNCSGSKCFQFNNEYYFLPYHDIDSAMQYLLPWRLVQKIWFMVKIGNFPARATVALTCPVEIAQYQDREKRVFRELRHEGRIYIEGYEYENGLSGSLRFRAGNSGAYTGNAILTALFSGTLPDYPVLCEKYRDSNFLLWYSTENPMEFRFFYIRKSRIFQQRSTGFQIKNRPVQEPVRSQGPTLQGAELFAQWFRGKSIAYIKTEHDINSVLPNPPLMISPRMLEAFLQGLRGYTAMTERFCVATGCIDDRAYASDVVVPQLLGISELMFFVEGELRGQFSNANRQTMEEPNRFLFMLANYEIGAAWLKANAPGYSTAFCVNLRNHSYRFYHMH